MQVKLLIYKDYESNTALILAASDYGRIEDFGRNLDDYPSDLGVFPVDQSGLVIWEGIVEAEMDDWSGKIRELTPKEWNCLKEGKEIV